MVSRCQYDLTEPFGLRESSRLSNGMTVCLGSGHKRAREEKATNLMFRAAIQSHTASVTLHF